MKVDLSYEGFLGGFPLLDQFPAGMFDHDESQGSSNAARAFLIIEELIRRDLAGQGILARLALLQTFPRLLQAETPEGDSVREVDFPPDFVRQYAAQLCPAWYGRFLSKLTAEESEVFLKCLLAAHETWGMREGIGQVVKSMLEHCTHLEVPVEVEPLVPEERPIPDELQSRLKSRYSAVGVDFVIGSRLLSRPERCEIVVGPISRRSLERIENAGWAKNTEPAPKLTELADFASPFYLSPRIRILLAQTGFTLGAIPLGTTRLGLVDSEEEAGIAALVGTG